MFLWLAMMLVPTGAFGQGLDRPAYTLADVPALINSVTVIDDNGQRVVRRWKLPEVRYSLQVLDGSHSTASRYHIAQQLEWVVEEEFRRLQGEIPVRFTRKDGAGSPIQLVLAIDFPGAINAQHGEAVAKKAYAPIDVPLMRDCATPPVVKPGSGCHTLAQIERGEVLTIWKDGSLQSGICRMRYEPQDLCVDQVLSQALADGTQMQTICESWRYYGYNEGGDAIPREAAQEVPLPLDKLHLCKHAKERLRHPSVRDTFLEFWRKLLQSCLRQLAGVSGVAEFDQVYNGGNSITGICKGSAVKTKGVAKICKPGSQTSERNSVINNLPIYFTSELDCFLAKNSLALKRLVYYKFSDITKERAEEELKNGLIGLISE